MEISGPNVFTDPDAFYQFRISDGDLNCADPHLLRFTLNQIAKTVPELGALIANDIDAILNAPPEQRKIILGEIAKFAASSSEFSAPLTEHASSYALQFCAGFVSAFNDIPGNKVLFVCGRPYFQIMREARALRKRGFSTALVHLGDVSEDIQEFIAQSFDIQLQLPENLLILIAILSKLEAKLIHVQCWMHCFDLPLAPVVLQHKGDAKVICEFYDLLTVFSEKWALAQYSPEFAEFNFYIDEYVWAHGDGFLVRAPKMAHDDLRARYKFTAPIIEMHPYPSKNMTLGQKIDRKRNSGDTPNLVYAGSLTPLKEDGKPHWPRYADGGGVLSAYTKIVEQGINLTILHDPNRPLSHPDFAYYIDIANKFPNLELMDGISPKMLSERLSQFDFGISVVDFTPMDLDVRPILFKTAVATKIFAYLEADLPVIVNKEHEYTAEIIESHNLGFAVHSSELGEIRSKIAAFDYEQCLEDIRAFNINNTIEDKIERVINLYETLLSKRFNDSPDD
jgi:hypothetical protein